MEQKNDKQHLENVWRKQAKFMDNPAKSYGGFQKNDRRQTMIFILIYISKQY